MVVIDGEFRQSLSVSPGEILRLLADGVRVVGALSMGGALRPETRAHGMIGIGQIYPWYASGEIEGDDEVAVAYCPDRLALADRPAGTRPGLAPPGDRRRRPRRRPRPGCCSVGRAASSTRIATPRRLERLVAESLGPCAARRDAVRRAPEIPDVKSDDARLALNFVRLSLECHPIPGAIP